MSAAVDVRPPVRLTITVQSLPFLLLVTVLSAAVKAFVPADLFTRVLPRRASAAPPPRRHRAAPRHPRGRCRWAVLPGCERASVPVPNSLIRRRVTAAAAFGFLFSASGDQSECADRHHHRRHRHPPRPPGHGRRPPPGVPSHDRAERAAPPVDACTDGLPPTPA